MTRHESLAWAHMVARIFTGAVFLYASLDKLGDAERFLDIVREYHVVPSSLAPLAAVVIPWLEALTGAALILGYRWRGAAWVYVALLLGYTLGLSLNLLRGIEMVCGCFSMQDMDKVTWATVLRDVALLVPGVFVLTGRSTRAAMDDLIKKT